MSADDPSTPPTSPTDRRRKRSVVFNNHPSLEDIAHEDGKPSINIHDTTEVEAIVHEENNRGCFYHKSDSESDETPENSHHDQKSSGDDNVNIGQEGDKNEIETATYKTNENEEGFVDEYDVDTTVIREANKKNSQPFTNGIEYDETKPKRLPNPKKLHLDIKNQPSRVLQDSINYLISPDDPEADSPGRHRRRQYKDTLVSIRSEPNFKQFREQVDHNRPESDARPVSGGNHYQRSPDLGRRVISKSTSPVQKLITKSASPSTAHRTKRKISSDARLGTTQDRLQAKIPPKRKISSDARLVGHAFDMEQRMNLPTIEDVRQRKVSFDSTAVVNGNKTMPLNDEVFLPKVSENIAHEQTKDTRPDRYYIPDQYEECSPNTRLPKVYLTVEDEDAREISTQLYESEEKEGDPFNENDVDLVGYENRAYIADDEGSISSYTSANPPPYRIEYEEEPTRYHSNESPRRKIYDQPAVISHTTINEPVRNGQKISSSSLPASLGYRNSSPAQSLEDGIGPKSILKNRREDTDSMVSQDSMMEKKFNVRKDSIALFTSKSGEVALQQIRQEHKSRTKCFSGSCIKELWASRHDLLVRYKLHLLVLMLFTLTFAFVVVGLHLHGVHHDELAIAQKIFFDPKSRRLSLRDQSSTDTFRSTLGKNIPLWMSPTHCFQNYKDIHDKTCLKWKDHAQVDIAYFSYKNLQCYNVTWSTDGTTAPHDCFDLGDGYWYGPVNSTDGVWPISKASFTFSISKAKLYGSGTFSSAVEYYWISSNGYVILFDSNYPAEISWNKYVSRAACVQIKQTGDFYHSDQPVPKFSYTMCNGNDITDTHITIRQRYFLQINDIPNRYLLALPHWSSVSESESFQLNSSIITDLAKTIKKYELRCGTIEFDGQWEPVNGDLTFKERSFPNVTDLVSSVRSYKCKISLNIYPFFSFLSSNFQEGVAHNYFVMDVGRTVPALLKWEHGVGAMVDISNTEARDWLNAKLWNLTSEYNIRTFRLNYGKSAWIPYNPQFHLDDMNPNKVKGLFTDLISSLGNAVLQSTSQSQHKISIIGTESTIVQEDDRSCLRNLIPDIINYGLMGYPFIMADGLQLVQNKETGSVSMPSRDLYIRWMQFASFLPAVKYTIKPWSYDDEVVNAARNLSVFHDKIVVELIQNEREDILNGMPVIRPLWWNEPKDRMSFKVDDEFLLANQYLVAPILCESPEKGEMSERDIYVPKGVWRDMISDTIILGPRMINNYKVSQYMVPYFERMPEYGEV